jgi:DNA-directed RNA polymerase III subunit RPC2
MHTHTYNLQTYLHIQTLTLTGQKTLPTKYRLLDRDGLAAVGDYIAPGDVYINLQRPTNT